MEIMLSDMYLQAIIITISIYRGIMVDFVGVGMGHTAQRWNQRKLLNIWFAQTLISFWDTMCTNQVEILSFKDVMDI